MSAAKTPDEAADSTHGAKGGGFPETKWTRLLEVREEDEETRRAALDFLIRRYWKPVYLFIRREGQAEEEAKDLAQAFFTVALIRNLFARAKPKIGRFRNFLLKSLKHFLANARRDAQAKKRQPEHGFVSIHDLSSQDETIAVPNDSETPDEVYHRAWLQELVLRVLKNLESECVASGKRTHFELLKARIIDPVLDGKEAPSFRTLAGQYGLTEKEVANRVLTARRAYHRLLREEIRLYAVTDEEVAAEIQDLWRFMAE